MSLAARTGSGPDPGSLPGAGPWLTWRGEPRSPGSLPLAGVGRTGTVSRVLGPTRKTSSPWVCDPGWSGFPAAMKWGALPLPAQPKAGPPRGMQPPPSTRTGLPGGSMEPPLPQAGGPHTGPQPRPPWGLGPRRKEMQQPLAGAESPVHGRQQGGPGVPLVLSPLLSTHPHHQRLLMFPPTQKPALSPGTDQGLNPLPAALPGPGTGSRLTT